LSRSRSLRLRAFAKVNVSLRVLGIRGGGYHELRTTFQSLALHDTLTLQPERGPMSLSCDEAGCPTDRGNLVWQAAERVWRAAGRRGRPEGVAMRLDKRIPMQAGLGGGSSDAAAALRGLNAFWRAELSEARLQMEAARLGADVPFFLMGGTALGVERGDRLFPLVDSPPATVVLVQPSFGVSTREAYGWWDESFNSGDLPNTPSRSIMGLPEWGNDLEPPVVQRHAQIGVLVRSLQRRGAAGAAMSGSGSAVFGLFAERTTALEAASGLVAPGRIVTVTRTISRQEFQHGSAPK
jgi:4-diphosphocytidyl-2-C-methyl-D-erythritol kinase